ncbi:MAG: hydrogenase maturation nickel metallochaperone HypA [Coriobacteriaceae bacterium]|nr:hydrogenase maturation nickel metallochaperone HypA [Coriobacteriaceae bacterium]
MHELGIVFHMVDLLERVGKENELTRIQRVVLDLGEVSGVLEDQLQDCWKWASAKHDLLNGAELAVNRIPAVTVCNACGRTYGTVAHGRICPHCESPDTVLLRGNEMEVREVEAY